MDQAYSPELALTDQKETGGNTIAVSDKEKITVLFTPSVVKQWQNMLGTLI